MFRHHTKIKVLIVLSVFLMSNCEKLSFTDIEHSRLKSEKEALRFETEANSYEGNVWELSGQFEGDILFNFRRNAHRGGDMRWVNGTVPYLIDETFTECEKEHILNAFHRIQARTSSCIKFSRRKEFQKDYILITPTGRGCVSAVGRQGGMQKVILLPSKCLSYSVIVHELLHTLGFYHMQATPERDAFVKINWNNIKEDKYHQFQKYSAARVENYGFPYDYKSIMHYSDRAFSLNGEPTIEPIKSGAVIGKSQDLTDSDVKKLMIMYGCNNKMTEIAENSTSTETKL